MRVADVRVAGVDGCRGGWLAAIVANGGVEWVWTRDISEVVSRPLDAIAIDIPIGLPEDGVRDCDRAARALVGKRRSSVFPAPLRAVLECASYADARAVLARRGGASMSAQAFGIVRAVRAVDRAVSPHDEPRVVETHPEVSFRELVGHGLDGKKTATGREQRVAALAAIWPDADLLVAKAPRPAAPDDALDALVCAWSAQRWVRGDAVVLGDGARDARGLVMRIVA